MEGLPHNVRAYLRENFREENLLDVITVKDHSGHTVFKVNINENNMKHHLEFNEAGKLIRRESVPIFDDEDYR